MYVKNEHLYDKKTLEFCRHMRLLSSVNRLQILSVIKENNGCRIMQLVMETGLNTHQVYYHVSRLRKMGYIHSIFISGRLMLYKGFGNERYLDVLDLLENWTAHKSEDETGLEEWTSPLRVVN